MYRFQFIFFASLILLLAYTAIAEDYDEKLIVSIEPGLVRGIKTKDHYEFRKIPLAQPPVGNLRYRVIHIYLTILILFMNYDYDTCKILHIR
jgi:hypothetical protein